MATYINYGEGEDDATVQGAEWLQGMLGDSKKEEFAEKFKALNSESRSYDYGPIFDLFVEYSSELFGWITERGSEEGVKEVESFFALVLSMLMSFEDPKHLDEATTRLCELFSADSQQYPELRLRLLMMLYNTFNCPTIEFRYRVFKHVLDYAAKASIFDQVLPYLEHIDAWMADWDPYLKIDDKRILYRDIATYMRGMGKRLDAFTYLKRYHQYFQEEKDKKVLAQPEVMSLTVELIKDAVQLPSVIQFDDILKFDTVKELSKSKQGDLVKLCTVFLSGSVKDLTDFHGKNGKLFEEHGLSYPDAMSKIRLLTLATLTHGKSEISLGDVAKSLEEPEDGVERSVVHAISEGVIDGRIDQLNGKVLVKSSFQRTFEKKEWAFLDSRLDQWIDNLENVIKFIGEQKAAKAEIVA